MDAFLDAVVTLAQLGAAGVVVYGLVLALQADAWLVKALRVSRGEGVLPSRPANVNVSARAV